jgi:hypothetical protein
MLSLNFCHLFEPLAKLSFVLSNPYLVSKELSDFGEVLVFGE